MDTVTQIVINHGLIAIFFLMLTNGIISAPASELTLAFAGIYAATTSTTILSVLLASVLGNLSGALILFFLGRAAGDTWLLECRARFLNSRFPSVRVMSRLIPTRLFLGYISQKLNSNGAKWVGILRCFPVVRSIVSLPAGMSKMAFIKFFLYSTSGILIWCAGWITAGYLLKESWVQYGFYVSLSLAIMLLCLVIFAHRKVLTDYSLYTEMKAKQDSV